MMALLAARPHRRRSQVLTHALFSLPSQKCQLKHFTGKGKKAAKKPYAGKARQKNQPSTSDNKGKRKALADGDGSDAAVEDAKDKKTTKKPTKTKAQKSETTAAAKESHPADVENDDDTEDAAVPKKKKMRKLNVNIFGSAKADSLDWANQFNLVSLVQISLPGS
jgi:hypothetical protein